MISTFDIDKLVFLLTDFYNLTKIRITVFNEHFVELASYPEHIAPVCQIIRTDDNGKKQCKKCDEDACRRAAKQHSLYTYRCHAGLTESITPIFFENIIIGYLLFGHVFSYDTYDEGWNVIKSKCSDYNIDMDLLKKECFSMPIHSENYITSASHILAAVANFLCLERMAYLRHQELPVRIDGFIQKHFTEDIDAISIAKEFDIGKTQLYQICHQIYGTGIAEHIRMLRINKAKKLLAENTLPLATVSSLCGFNDYNYFITVFKSQVGISPKKYQKQLLTHIDFKS